MFFLYLKYIFDRKNYQIYKMNKTTNNQPENLNNNKFEDLTRLVQDLKEQVKINVNSVELSLKNQINQELKITNEKIKSSTKTTEEQIKSLKEISSEQIKSLKEISEKNLNNNKESIEEKIKNFSLNIKDSLDKNVHSLNDIKKLFENNKLRGNVGENYLEAILTDNLGFGNNSLWQKQYKFKNDKQVDFVIMHPGLKKVIPIDCKFPLDKIRTILYSENLENKTEILKEIKTDVNKMISDIKTKYINENETTGFALMFIPSEGIYNFLLANFNDLFLNASKQAVYICSPTNVLAIISVFIAATRQIQLYENIKPIIIKIENIQKEYGRLFSRWIQHVKDIDKVTSSVKDLNITFTKLSKQSQEISLTSQKNDANINLQTELVQNAENPIN